MLLSHNQLGVGAKGGLETAIHSTRFVIDQLKDNPDMCLLKIDFSNAFNECSRTSFLSKVNDLFPEIFGWVQFSYHTGAEL